VEELVGANASLIGRGRGGFGLSGLGFGDSQVEERVEGFCLIYSTLQVVVERSGSDLAVMLVTAQGVDPV
jgi:hypothetical protein